MNTFFTKSNLAMKSVSINAVVIVLLKLLSLAKRQPMTSPVVKKVILVQKVQLEVMEAKDALVPRNLIRSVFVSYFMRLTDLSILINCYGTVLISIIRELKKHFSKFSLPNCPFIEHSAVEYSQNINKRLHIISIKVGSH